MFRPTRLYFKRISFLSAGLVSSVFVLCSPVVHSQDNSFDFTRVPESGLRLRAEVIHKDTVAVVDLNTVYIYGDLVFKNPAHYEQWTRIKCNVKKVYPYAILASMKLKEYDKVLEKIENPHLKKQFIKACEHDLRNQFEHELTSLTISQGKLLMKLLDRETGRTTYEIVKQMRGGFQAAMWQAVATVFGHNMKVEYDPIHEDMMIEQAIKVVEGGFF